MGQKASSESTQNEESEILERETRLAKETTKLQVKKGHTKPSSSTVGRDSIDIGDDPGPDRYGGVAILSDAVRLSASDGEEFLHYLLDQGVGGKCWAHSTEGSSAWIQADFTSPTSYSITSYGLRNGGDKAECDPVSWQFRGKLAATGEWATLHSVTEEAGRGFAARSQWLWFDISDPQEVTAVFLKIKKARKAGSGVQLARLRIKGFTTESGLNLPAKVSETKQKKTKAKSKGDKGDANADFAVATAAVTAAVEGVLVEEGAKKKVKKKVSKSDVAGGNEGGGDDAAAEVKPKKKKEGSKLKSKAGKDEAVGDPVTTAAEEISKLLPPSSVGSASAVGATSVAKGKVKSSADKIANPDVSEASVKPPVNVTQPPQSTSAASAAVVHSTAQTFTKVPGERVLVGATVRGTTGTGSAAGSKPAPGLQSDASRTSGSTSDATVAQEIYTRALASPAIADNPSSRHTTKGGSLSASAAAPPAAPPSAPPTVAAEEQEAHTKRGGFFKSFSKATEGFVTELQSGIRTATSHTQEVAHRAFKSSHSSTHASSSSGAAAAAAAAATIDITDTAQQSEGLSAQPEEGDGDVLLTSDVPKKKKKGVIRAVGKAFKKLGIAAGIRKDKNAAQDPSGAGTHGPDGQVLYAEGDVEFASEEEDGEEEDGEGEEDGYQPDITEEDSYNMLYGLKGDEGGQTPERNRQGNVGTGQEYTPSSPGEALASSLYGSFLDEDLPPNEPATERMNSVQASLGMWEFFDRKADVQTDIQDYPNNAGDNDLTMWDVLAGATVDPQTGSLAYNANGGMYAEETDASVSVLGLYQVMLDPQQPEYEQQGQQQQQPQGEQSHRHSDVLQALESMWDRK